MRAFLGDSLARLASRDLQRPRWTIFAVVVIVLGGSVLYAPSLTIGYITDDYALIEAAVSPDYSILEKFPARGQTGVYFRPLVILGLRWEQSLQLADPILIHHLSNLGLHLLNAILVLAICQLLTGRLVLSAGLAGLFLVHPANITNVYWIAGRTDSMSTLFYLIGLWGLVKFIHRPSRFWLLVIGLGLMASLLSKEMGITLGPVLAIMFLLMRKWGRPRPRFSKLQCRQVAWIAICIVVISAAYLVHQYLRFYRPGIAQLQLVSIREAATALMQYPVSLFAPYSRSLVYQIYRANPWLLPAAIASIAAGASAVIIWMRRQAKDLRLALTLCALAFTPLLPLAIAAGDIEGRLAYLPIAVLCITIAAWVMARPQVIRRVILIIYPLIVFMTLSTHKHAKTWVQSWKMSESYCHSFRAAISDLPQDPKLAILTSPYLLVDTPIYAHFLNQALFYCLNEQFGFFSQFGWISNLKIAHSDIGRETVSVENPQPGVYQVSLQSNDSIFAFPEGSRIGSTYAHPLVTLSVSALNQDDQVTGFTATFTDPQWLSERLLIYFNGNEFRPIAHDQLSEKR